MPRLQVGSSQAYKVLDSSVTRCRDNNGGRHSRTSRRRDTAIQVDSSVPLRSSERDDRSQSGQGEDYLPIRAIDEHKPTLYKLFFLANKHKPTLYKLFFLVNEYKPTLHRLFFLVDEYKPTLYKLFFLVNKYKPTLHRLFFLVDEYKPTLERLFFLVDEIKLTIVQLFLSC
jgi:hypothetical protein